MNWPIESNGNDGSGFLMGLKSNFPAPTTCNQACPQNSSSIYESQGCNEKEAGTVGAFPQIRTSGGEVYKKVALGSIISNWRASEPLA